MPKPRNLGPLALHFPRSHSRVRKTRPETMKIRGTRCHLVPRFRRSHSRVRRTRPETMKFRGTRWHLVPRFRRSRMRKVRVVSKKYDGSLRDEYETYLYDESDETIRLISIPGLSYWDHRKGAWFEGTDGLLEIYFKRRWYNVWHMAEQISNLNLIYVNIALPAMLQGNVVEWTDLDLV